MRFLRVFFVVSDRDVLYPRSEVISSVGKRIHVDEYRTVRFVVRACSPWVSCRPSTGAKRDFYNRFTEPPKRRPVSGWFDRRSFAGARGNVSADPVHRRRGSLRGKIILAFFRRLVAGRRLRESGRCGYRSFPPALRCA